MDSGISIRSCRVIQEAPSGEISIIIRRRAGYQSVPRRWLEIRRFGLAAVSAVRLGVDA